MIMGTKYELAPLPPAALFAAVGGSRAASLKVWDRVSTLGYDLPMDYAVRAPTVEALAFLVGVPARTWRRWAAGDTRMPLAAQRLVETVAGLEGLHLEVVL